MVTLPVKAFHRERLTVLADGLAAAIAVSLPLSTSATSILVVLWLLALLPTMQLSDLRREVLTPAGGLPVALWLLAFAGIAWSDVGWSERFAGLGGYHKLLMIPLLLAQFRRSQHSHWVFGGFFVGAALVLGVSWVLTIFPELAWKTLSNQGVPVKDYLTQSGIFQLSVFALAYFAFDAWRQNKRAQALVSVVLALLFLANIVYVASGRTALVLLPIFALLLGFRLFGWRGIVSAGVAGAVLGGVIWNSSPYMRLRLSGLIEEARHDPHSETMTSASQRLEYYRKSKDIVLDAPIFGHGTGTIQARFRELAAGQTGAAGIASRNPHQQTFAIGIQLGLVGIAILWAMWAAHFLLFCRPGMVAWFGLIVVSQNILASLFNSHLFDFTQGWIYVFGVGVLGGAVLREAAMRASALHDGTNPRQ